MLKILKGAGLDNLVFDNRYVRELPADVETANYRRQVLGACYSSVLPTKVSNPQLVSFSREMAEELGLTEEDCLSDRFSQIFAGNQLLDGMEPYSMCYGGHQFGQWAGQLGDGRAINLGEVVTATNKRWVLQLKGSGPTPYSRSGDGWAVLRSSVREFLCSEAMYHLGIPTTRALSLVLTGEQVVRDMFYNGNARPEPGAIVCRVSPSFIRFGNFQIYAARNETGLLKQFLDFTLRRDFPHLLVARTEPDKSVYLKWFEEVCLRTAEMIVHWQRVGFVHGVMNTDNMSILGLTIDYGPYGWLENYDPDWTPNTTDAEMRRYSFGQQPAIALWNLVQLANAVFPLIGEAEPLQEILKCYNRAFQQGWQKMMAAKLGFKAFDDRQDEGLCSELLALLAEVETDMTIFYRNLALLDVEQDLSQLDGTALLKPVEEAWYQEDKITPEYKQHLAAWLRAYMHRLQQEGVRQQDKKQQMDSVNPKYVLRNYLAQLAIDKAEQGDFSQVDELLEVMRHPYDEQPEKQRYAEKRPDWARHKPGCSMLSCSS